MGQIKDFIQYIFDLIKIWIIVQPWESGLRVRAGKTPLLLKGGIHFRIPYIDSVYVQEIRTMVIPMPIQTLTSSDLNSITINGSVAYSISDLHKLYNTLRFPELMVVNLAQSAVADFIFNHTLKEITPSKIEAFVNDRLKLADYGLNIEYFKIGNFAVVKTFRLIQDHSWVSEGLKLDTKK